MVFGWMLNPAHQNRRESFSRAISGEETPAASTSAPVSPTPSIDSPIADAPQQPARRRSIFERRVSLGSDEFSREYADAVGDMWLSECDQGDSGHLGTLRKGIFTQKVPLGEDTFSREYFDSMEDTFVAETELGDSGFVRRNSRIADFDIPDALRRAGEMLRMPVKVGSDEFSREYAGVTEDTWLAQSGKAASGKMPSGPSLLMRRVMLGSDEFSREYADMSTDNWLAESDLGDAAKIRGLTRRTSLRGN